MHKIERGIEGERDQNRCGRQRESLSERSCCQHTLPGDKGLHCNSVVVLYFVLMSNILGFLPVPYAIKCL